MKRIAIDDGTYGTLRALADENGRTIVGQLRWLLNSKWSATTTVDNSQRTTAKPSDEGKSEEEESELQAMINRLKYFEEGSPEYDAALDRISELQKNA